LTALHRGAVAQLGERLNGIQEVVGSIPIGSTKCLKQINHLVFLEGHANSLDPEIVRVLSVFHY
jgi:hypothetical protein